MKGRMVAMSGMVRATGAAVLLALGACGGGGGGGGGLNLPLQLQFLQNPLSQTVYQWDLPKSGSGMEYRVAVDTRVTGTSSATTYYVVVADQAATFKPGMATVSQESPDVYRAELLLRDDLSLGLHSGNLQVRVCGDAGCSVLLASAQLPYRITAAPNPTFTMSPSPATLVGKALVTHGSGPAVAGFHVPTLTVDDLGQLPSQYRSPIYIRVTDADGRIVVAGNDDDYFYMSALPQDGSFPMDFSVAPNIARGHYTGTLTFQVCRDSACDVPFSGSTSLPYDLTVDDGTQTALNPAAGAKDWQTSLGDSVHNAYVPLTVAAGKLSPRWISDVASSDSYNYSIDIVTAAGNVFVARIGDYQSEFTDLYALRESDGSQDWSKQLEGGTASSLLAANGNIYVESAIYNEDAVLHAFAADSGATVFEKQTASHYANGPPQALGADVLIADTIDGPNGYNQHFNRYDGQTGALISGPSCLQPVEWQDVNQGGSRMRQTPLIKDEKAYIFMQSGLETIDFSPAQSCSHLDGGNLYNFTDTLTPSGNLLYCPSDALTSINATTGAYNWSQSIGDCYAGNAAVANGVVYNVALFRGLEARDEQTGELLWSWKADGFDLGGKVLVTDNMVFVKSGRLYAIDLATHKVVWTLSPTEGGMALSPNGVLYLTDRPGYPSTEWALIAINVR